MSVVKEGFRITEIWAFLTVDSDGDEGVCATRTPSGVWIPLIAADKELLDSLRPLAERLASENKRTVRLVRFHAKEVLEEF
jgi:hypothetical protein